MRVLRIYHSGRDSAHRERERALAAAGVDLTLLVPTAWPDNGGERILSPEPFVVLEADIRRAGDVNRHRFADPARLRLLVDRLRPDVVDVHEEPFSTVLHQVTGVLAAEQCVVAYTAQNLDKRFPPPFAQRERRALGRLQGLYPCSAQAASVAVGKGFRGVTRVLPLAPSIAITPGRQQLPDTELRLLLVGRFVPEKGLLDAVAVLAALQAGGPTTLTLVGAGPDAERAAGEASRLGVTDAVTVLPWLSAEELAAQYRQAHVLLATSHTTGTWVEQFGRMVVEAHAGGAVVAGYASGALPEVVGDAGVLVAEGDVTALAAAVTDLRARPERWAELRDRGFRAAEATTWSAVARGQVQLYEAALAQAPPGGRARPARATARARFGPPATVGGLARPFALPLLRDEVPGTRALARALDAVTRREQPEVREDAGRLRVVFLDHVAVLSGGELALLRLIAAMPEVTAHVILGEDGPLRGELEAAAVDVEILTLHERTRNARRHKLGGVLAALGSGVLLLVYTVRLARRLHRLAPDVVHTNSLKSGFYGTVAARLARIPVVWHVRDCIAPDYLPAPVVRVTRWALAHLPNVVVANSQSTLATTGVNRGPGSVKLTSEVATELGGHVVHDPYHARRVARANRPGTPFTIGVVGRLAPWKGQDVVLRALVHPDLSGVQLRLTGSAMFGEDTWEAGLRELVKTLGLTDRVTFVGFVADVVGELARLDLLVHASVIPEPFGQVVVEGMAAGLPVVAADAGGPAETITDGVDGVLVAPGDADALAEAIVRLRADPAERSRLGAAAVVRAREFAPEVIGARMTDVYRLLLAGAVTPRTRRR